jgi:hypothetical protein
MQISVCNYHTIALILLLINERDSVLSEVPAETEEIVDD